jgi:hypothetical protein
MKVERYNQEILTYLQEKNIFVENGGDHNVNYLGIVLNTIKNDVVLDKSVLIAKNPATFTPRDFNIILLERGYGSEMSTGDYLKDNAAFNKFFEQEVGQKITFKGGNKDGQEFLFVHADNCSFYQHIIMVLASILPPLLRPMFEPDEIKAVAPYLREIVKCEMADIEDLICGRSAIDFDGFETARNRRMMLECAKAANDSRQRRAKERYNNLVRQCNEYLEYYNDKLRELNEQISIMGAGESQGIEYMDEFINFMETNKRVKIIDINGSAITYDVLAELDFFDPDMYDRYTENLNSYVYRLCPESKRKTMRKMLDDIFVNRKYKVNLMSTFKLNFDNIGSIESGISNYSELKRKYKGRIGSPHVVLYHCTGEFPNLWRVALENGDYISAVVNTVNYASNLSWADSTVGARFIEEFHSKKCIEDAKGNLYTADELLEIYCKEAA